MNKEIEIKDEKLTRKERIDNIKHTNVKRLVEERNDKELLPSYPSAQWWRNATQEERDELVNHIERSGTSWATYEREMKALWPKR